MTPTVFVNDIKKVIIGEKEAYSFNSRLDEHMSVKIEVAAEKIYLLIEANDSEMTSVILEGAPASIQGGFSSLFNATVVANHLDYAYGIY